MDDRWHTIRQASQVRGWGVRQAEAQRALAILDAVTAPGTEVFGIVRWTRPDGEERVDMPVDVLGFLRTQLSLTWNQMRGRLLNEVDGIAYKWDMPADIESRLAARYEDATAPPPPKWETAAADAWARATSQALSPGARYLMVIEAVRAALAEERAE